MRNNLYELLYAACLQAARELGPEIKGLSWFACNAPLTESKVEKKAA